MAVMSLKIWSLRLMKCQDEMRDSGLFISVSFEVRRGRYLIAQLRKFQSRSCPMVRAATTAGHAWFLVWILMISLIRRYYHPSLAAMACWPCSVPCQAGMKVHEKISKCDDYIICQLKLYWHSPWKKLMSLSKEHWLHTISFLEIWHLFLNNSYTIAT